MSQISRERENGRTDAATKVIRILYFFGFLPRSYVDEVSELKIKRKLKCEAARHRDDVARQNGCVYTSQTREAQKKQRMSG